MRDLYHCKIPKRYSSFFLSALRSFFIQTRCFLDIVDGLVHLYYGIVLFKSHIIKVGSEVFSILFVMMDGIYSLFSKFIWLCPLWE